MKKVIIRTVAILIIPVLIVISLIFIPSQYEETFMGELKYKYQRLSHIEGKRIVIIGGSAMAFGVDSALLKDNFPDHQIVNMGMYAALGSRAILDLCLSDIRKDDLVIFAPEQNHQTLSLDFGADYCLQGCDGAFYMLPRFITSEDNAAGILAAIPGFALQKAQYFFTDSAPIPDTVYRKSAFNEYGDIKVELPENIMPAGYDSNILISYNSDVIDKDFINYLDSYSKKVSQKGATFVFAYAPANAKALTSGDDLDEYHLLLDDYFDFPIIGDPHNSVLGPEWFYDTNYHLNSSGKRLYTRQLIRDIKAFLKDSSATNIEVPPAPAINLAEASQNTILRANEYAGNTDIKSVTIDENVSMIEDYAFLGCTALKEIHIKNTDPSAIQIGQHLLDGTNANIYVPQSSVSVYKTDYQFSLYAGRIYGE